MGVSSFVPVRALECFLLRRSGKAVWSISVNWADENQRNYVNVPTVMVVTLIRHVTCALKFIVKTTELLTRLCGNGIDTIDLNCGCPLDMVFKTGAGSALLDNQGKMIKMLRGMVQVSGEIPVTCKIRMGVYKEKNTAQKLLRRLVVENIGVSAVTLHGRSRQQRYSNVESGC